MKSEGSDALFVCKGILFMSLNLGFLRSTFSCPVYKRRNRGPEKEVRLPKMTCLVSERRQGLNSRCLELGVQYPNYTMHANHKH